MSDAELALLGHLIGDGCTLPRHAIQYTSKDGDLADTVRRARNRQSSATPSSRASSASGPGSRRTYQRARRLDARRAQPRGGVARRARRLRTACAGRSASPEKVFAAATSTESRSSCGISGRRTVASGLGRKGELPGGLVRLVERAACDRRAIAVAPTRHLRTSHAQCRCEQGTPEPDGDRVRESVTSSVSSTPSAASAIRKSTACKEVTRATREL